MDEKRKRKKKKLQNINEKCKFFFISVCFALLNIHSNKMAKEDVVIFPVGAMCSVCRAGCPRTTHSIRRLIIFIVNHPESIIICGWQKKGAANVCFSLINFGKQKLPAYGIIFTF